jgi:hypothetical protein
MLPGPSIAHRVRVMATRLTLLASVAVATGVGIQAVAGVAATAPSASSLAAAIREAATASTHQAIGEHQPPSTTSILFPGPQGSSLAQPAELTASASSAISAAEPQETLVEDSISGLATTVFLANLQVLLLPMLLPVVQTASAVQVIRLLRRRPNAGPLLSI